MLLGFGFGCNVTRLTRGFSWSCRRLRGNASRWFRTCGFDLGCDVTLLTGRQYSGATRRFKTCG